MESKPITIELLADAVKITGPRIDGSYALTFSCGAYMKEAIAELLKMPEVVMELSITEYQK